MIDRAHDLPISQQAAALNISRGSIYYLPRAVPEADLAIMRTTLEHRARVTVSPADWAGESFCIEWLILPWAVRESGERRFLAKACMTERFSITVQEQFAGKLEAMSAEPQQPGPPGVETAASTVPMGLRILAIFLRTVFIGALLAVTVRLSSPQSETIWTVYESPGDLIRLALGFTVCVWIVIHLFMFPKTAEGYRAWVYLGLVIAPLTLAIAIAIW